MSITKAAINREIKGNGGVHHRTRDETVAAIKRYFDRYGTEAIRSAAILLWSIGFSWEDAAGAATRLSQEQET